MRNLVEHPLQPDEVHNALMLALEEHDEKKIYGSLQGISLLVVDEFINAYKDEFAIFLAQSPAGGCV